MQLIYFSFSAVFGVVEAVSFIQIHERARQGRLRFQLMKQIRQQKMQAGRGLHKLKPAMNPNTAALKIQSAWRR